MKELWNGFIKWFHYVLDYKDNVEYLDIKEGEVCELNKKIEKLKIRLEEKETYIKALEEKIVELKKRKKRKAKKEGE